MIGAYYRLSMADEDINETKKESNSIHNQRLLVTDFIKKMPELKKEPVEEFVDDGYSGTTVKRPEFERMIKMIRNGQIKTVIVKDFSRFARDYIEAGDYLERIFPFMGIRFISVNDYYDSENHMKDSFQDMEMVIKNIINTAYSRDLSAKIAATKKNRRNKALYTGGLKPFGFQSDPEDLHKVILDPVASKYVRMVFELALEGYKTPKIAKILNERKIPTPAEYMVEKEKFSSEQKSWDLNGIVWNSCKVRSILRNEKYKGTYVAKKYTQAAPCSKKIIKSKDEDVVMIENAHIGMVTPEEFEKAQEVLKVVSKTGKTRKQLMYPLKGKVTCGYCRRKMTHYDQFKMGEFFKCRYSESIPDSECRGDEVSSDALQDIIKESLSAQILLLSRATDMIDQHEKDVLNRKAELECSREQMINERQNIIAEKAKYYEQYADEQISREHFLKVKEELENKKNRLEEKLEEIKVEIKTLVLEKNETYDEMRQAKSKIEKQPIEELSIQAIEEFVEQIFVYNNERIEIQWKFQDELEKLFMEHMKNA